MKRSAIGNRKSTIDGALARRLWWLDRLNNLGRVLGVAFLWAAILMLIGFKNLWLISIAGIGLGYVAVWWWDDRQTRRHLEKMRRETMERHQIAEDWFAAKPRNGNGKLP